MSVDDLRALGVASRGICFLSTTKNPYSWLLSLHRKPYNHQFDHGMPDFETFLRTPWKTDGRDNCEALLENPVMLWNKKNASYLRLTEFNGLNITTESLLADPAAVIDRISNHFSIRRRVPDFINYEVSTKNNVRDFAYYQDYYLHEKWRKKLSAEAISFIGETVDKTLMHSLRI